MNYSLAKIKHVFDSSIDFVLQMKAPGAILQAIQLMRLKQAWTIFFSKHHSNYLFSLGWFKRLLMLLKASITYQINR